MKTLFWCLLVGPWIIGAIALVPFLLHSVYEVIYYYFHPELVTNDVGPK